MPRIARVIAPDFPHHIVQRGNRSQNVFFVKKDYIEYLQLLHTHAKRFKTNILAYCLMPNHVHIIAVPEQKESLAQAIGETHRKYTRIINERHNWRGYLWQGRFSSYVLDEPYLLAAARYILLNPVKAGIVKCPQDYQWSSIKHHLKKEKSPIINDIFLTDIISDWEEFLQQKVNENDIKLFKLHERTGRPLGQSVFIEKLGKNLNRDFKKRKPGRQKTRGIKN
jgi:putative transposase